MRGTASVSRCEVILGQVGPCQVLIDGVVGMWEFDPVSAQKPHSDKGVVSMSRRNSRPKSYLQMFQWLNSFARVNSKEHCPV